MEQSEGDGHPHVEGSRGDSDLAAGRAAGRPRGTGLRHAGDAVQRQQAASVSAASGAERQLHEGERTRPLALLLGGPLWECESQTHVMQIHSKT